LIAKGRNLINFRSALKCVKPGGSVVYSTCSLSPVQNDGVVYNALKSIWEDTKIEFAVR
jgi:16S rRNA C967 or C1407 C5-methylase (RsmB/RsmF family)